MYTSESETAGLGEILLALSVIRDLREDAVQMR